MWENSSWDMSTLDDYFAKWHDRFDLFSEEHPFYQVASIEPDRAVPIAKLTHELASGNNATLFDHTSSSGDLSFSPDRAARYLLACQSFSVGGLVSSLKGEDRKVFGSADASPLTKGAVVMAKGSDLFETLMLNMHRYNLEDEDPFPAELDDAPAWELSEPTTAKDRHPRGYLDLLTWQSRRIRLFPERDADGAIVVRRVAIMKGYQFPSEDELHSKETMLAFVKNPRAKSSEDPWPVVGFQEERAVWRDSLALMQSAEDIRDRPMMLSWLNELAFEGFIDRSQTLPIDLYGLSTDRANVLLWRHERLPLPLEYLNNEDLLSKLNDALRIAEEVSRLFNRGYDEIRTKEGTKSVPRPMQVLAEALLTTSTERHPDKEDVSDVMKHLAPGRLYWSRLDNPFRSFLIDLAADADEVDGEEVYGNTQMPLWIGTVEEAARSTFRNVTGDLGTSARDLRAVALAERAFNLRLAVILKRYRPEEHKQEVTK